MEKQYKYYFDMIRINSRVDLRTLCDKLPRKELEEESYKLVIKPPYPIAKSFGYSSCIEIVVPSKIALNILLQNENILGRYSISHIEIARDFSCKTKFDAELELDNVRSTYKKYSTKYKLYDSDIPRRAGIMVESRRDPLLFSPRTLYMGSKPFQYIIYPRLSKFDGEPVLHAEWKIKGASKIKEKTEIKAIKDIIDFDIISFFSRQDKSQLLSATIDYIKFGIWYLKNDLRRKKYTDVETKRFKQYSRQYFKGYKIKTFGELRDHIDYLKKEIKAKPGKRSKRDLKILKVNPNIFRKKDTDT